jgi:hypothetical protein
MTNYNQVTGSGDGTRPVTDGGVNNIGAGEKLSTKRTATGEEVSSPAPKERMSDNRRDVEGTKHDDSAAFELHEDLSTDTNKQPTPGPEEHPVNQPKS